MRKILSVLALLSLLAVLVPIIASAQTAPVDSCTVTADRGRKINTYLSDCPAAGGTYDESTAGTTWGMCCMFNAILTITDWIFVILVSLVVLLVIFGAFQIMTAGGAPEKVSAGRSYIIYAMLGLVIALFAKAIPSVVKALVGL